MHVDYQWKGAHTFVSQADTVDFGFLWRETDRLTNYLVVKYTVNFSDTSVLNHEGKALLNT